MSVEPGFTTIESGPHRYPTPRGEIHVDRPLDEISLMRLFAAATVVNVEWRWVKRAKVGPTMVGFEVMDHEGPRAVRDGNDEIVTRWFWATA